jgi:hypothetical protein
VRSVAIRLASGGDLEIAAAGKPDCYWVLVAATDNYWPFIAAVILSTL